MDEVLLQKLSMAIGQAAKGKVVDEVWDRRGEESVIEGMDVLTMPWSPYSRLGSEAGFNDDVWEEEEDLLEAGSESEGEELEEGSTGEGSVGEMEGGHGKEAPTNPDNKRKVYTDFQEYIRERFTERHCTECKGEICCLTYATLIA